MLAIGLAMQHSYHREEDENEYYNMGPRSIDDYVVIKKIYKGTYGHVDLVLRLLDDQTMVRKVVHLTEESTLPTSLLDLSHSNLLKHYNFTCHGGEGLFVMEYCENKNLAFAVENEKSLLKGKFMPECQIITWFYEMCCGVDYLHQRNMIHRFLKPENILMNNEGHLKVGDYLMSTLFNNQDPRVLPMSAYQFMAPELWENKSTCTNKVDIWSLGCLLYYMCAYKPPFEGISLGFVYNAVCNHEPPPIAHGFTQKLRDVLSGVLSKKANNRPNVTDILCNDLFRATSQVMSYVEDDDKYYSVIRQSLIEQMQSRPLGIVIESGIFETESEPCNDQLSNLESPMEERRLKRPSMYPGVVGSTTNSQISSVSDSNSNQSPFKWHGMDLRDADLQGRYPIINFHDAGPAAKDAWIYAVSYQTEGAQLSLPPMRLSFCNTVIVAWFWRRGDDLRMGVKLHRNCASSDTAKCISVHLRTDIIVKTRKGLDKKKKFTQEQISHIHPTLGWWNQVTTFKNLKFNKLDPLVLPQVLICITPSQGNGSLWFSGLAPSKMKIDWRTLGGCENWCENWKRIVGNVPNWRLNLPPYPVKIGGVGSEVMVIGLLRRTSDNHLCLHLALHYNTPGDVTLTAALAFTLNLSRCRENVGKKEDLQLKYCFEQVIEDMTPSVGPAIDLLPPVITMTDVSWNTLDPLTPPLASISITCRSVGGSIIYN